MTQDALWRLAWPFLGSVSVRVKILGIVAGLALLLGGGIAVQVRIGQEAMLGEELSRRGVSIAQDVAARGTDYLLTSNAFALHGLLRETIENNEDVRYVFVLDPEERVIAHTFARGLPRGLAAANRTASASRYHLETFATEEGLMRDVAVPILEGRAGTVRVGMSDVRLRSLVAATTQQILVATGLALLVGLAFAYLLTVVVTRPIQELVEVTEAVGSGDLGRQTRVWAWDEIGHLSRAFNDMTAHLARSREEVLRRNRELAALNAVAGVISRQFSREEVLAASLDKVLQVMDLQAGAILLPVPATQTLEVVAAAGPLGDVAAAEPCPGTANCLCWNVLLSGRLQTVEDVSAACPRLVNGGGAAAGLQAGVCVALVSKDRSLGVLYVASAEPHPFVEEQLSILRSIGHQIGVAIENAYLWEELKQREALRTHLLERVIAAQEEERRRIARELHDDLAQGLTALLMSLEAAESKIPADLAEVQERLARTRLLTTRSLDETRRLILDLRPAALDSLGLVPAIRWYAEHRLEPLDIDVQLEARGLSGRFSPSVETTVFRLAQEAVNNVARHSGARSMRIQIEQTSSSVTLLAVDDGRGFAVDRVLAANGGEPAGLGLLGMRERAVLLGGTMAVESAPGKGTRLRLEIPLAGGGGPS